jgi:hypothetical protein
MDEEDAFSMRCEDVGGIRAGDDPYRFFFRFCPHF